MTVEELITELDTMPADADVLVVGVTTRPIISVEYGEEQVLLVVEK